MEFETRPDAARRPATDFGAPGVVSHFKGPFADGPPPQALHVDTPTLDTLISRFTVGNIEDMSRPPRSAVTVRASLASAKRSVSSGSRTNARTTRIPEKVSPTRPSIASTSFRTER